MTTEMSKFEQLKDMLAALEALVFTKEDRIGIMRPFMDEVRSMGVTGFTFTTKLPTFNDGDPCVATISFGCGLKVEPVPIMITRYSDDDDDADPNAEVDSWEEVEYSTEGLEDGWGDLFTVSDLYESSNPEYRAHIIAISKAYSSLRSDFLEVLLEAQKLEIDSEYKYEWVGDSVTETVTSIW